MMGTQSLVPFIFKQFENQTLKSNLGVKYKEKYIDSFQPHTLPWNCHVYIVLCILYLCHLRQ
jgi:hypothetical protein